MTGEGSDMSDDSARAEDFDSDELIHDRVTPLSDSPEVRAKLDAAIREPLKREPPTQ